MTARFFRDRVGDRVHWLFDYDGEVAEAMCGHRLADPEWIKSPRVIHQCGSCRPIAQSRKVRAGRLRAMIYLRRELMRKLRAMAYDEGTSISAVVERLVEDRS